MDQSDWLRPSVVSVTRCSTWMSLEHHKRISDEGEASSMHILSNTIIPNLNACFRHSQIDHEIARYFIACWPLVAILLMVTDNSNYNEF
eukprot:scaffold1697_cov120-Cylindrotheca_fusiformis.AAC.22